eukprot:5063789-Prymnesium_polylepis.1
MRHVAAVEVAVRAQLLDVAGEGAQVVRRARREAALRAVVGKRLDARAHARRRRAERRGRPLVDPAHVALPDV